MPNIANNITELIGNTGISLAANCAAQNLKLILTILCDTGERYLSTELFSE